MSASTRPNFKASNVSVDNRRELDMMLVIVVNTRQSLVAALFQVEAIFVSS